MPPLARTLQPITFRNIDFVVYRAGHHRVPYAGWKELSGCLAAVVVILWQSSLCQQSPDELHQTGARPRICCCTGNLGRLSRQLQRIDFVCHRSVSSPIESEFLLETSVVH